MDDQTKASLSDRAVWVRILYMLFFAIAYSIAEILVVVVAVFQSICALFTGGVNQTVLSFGRNLTIYIADILQFVTYSSDELPFPFSDWPDHSADDSPWFEESFEEKHEAGLQENASAPTVVPDEPAQPASTSESESTGEPGQPDAPEQDPDQNPKQ